MQRSDWGETELREKTQVHTRVAHVAALLSVHTCGHVRTWVCLTTDSHTSIHIQYVRMCTYTHRITYELYTSIPASLAHL